MKHKLVFFIFFVAVFVIVALGVTPGYYNATAPNEYDNQTSLLGKILYGVNNGVVTYGTVTLSGTSLTPVFASLTTSGTIAAGYHTIDLLFSPNFVGTFVLTGTLSVSGSTLTAYSFPPVAGTTISAIPYTISTGTMQMSAR